MRFLLFIRDEDIEKFEKEYISKSFLIFLTRYLEVKLLGQEEVSSLSRILHQNRLINISLQLQERPIYILETHDEYYEAQEHAWHDGEFKLIFRRLDTFQFVEMLGELIKYQYMDINEVNDLLEKGKLSFRYKSASKSSSGLVAKFLKTSEIEELLKDEGNESYHENVFVLFNRMDAAFKAKDFTLVLSQAASVFELVAKDVIDDKKYDGKTFHSLLKKYKEVSGLPEAAVDYMNKVYIERGRTPLAAHGSRLDVPKMSEKDALTLIEITKAFVKIEYKSLESTKVEL